MSPFWTSQSRWPSQPGSSLQPGMLVSLGEPTRAKMRMHWSMSVLPSRMGLRSNISAKTHLDIVLGDA